MYLVTIINSNVETVINAVSTDINAPRISGTVKQGINSIDSFSFTILPNNKGYNLIYPYRTLVKVLNTKNNKYEFIGRTLKPTGSMNSNGLISKSFICESEMAYLLDTVQSYEEVHNLSVKDYLEKLIHVHNSKTSNDKKFKVGNVTVKDNNDSLYKYIAYETTKKNIDDDLLNKLGGELKIRYENDERYLDYLTETGKACETEIRLGKNIKDISEDKDPTSYITRLTPLGCKLKKKETDSEGNITEVDTEERLTIETANNGLSYIDDEEGIKQFGIIEGFITYDDVTESKNLLSKGQNYIKSQRVIISKKITALDLSLLGLDIDNFEVRNYYPLKHELLGIDDVVRIIDKTITIESPESTSLTFGDGQKDIKQYQLDTKKKYIEVKKIAEKAKDKANQVEKYTIDEICRVNDRVNAAMTDTNNKFEDTNKAIENIKSRIKNVSNEEEFKAALLSGGSIYINKTFSIENSHKIKSNTTLEMGQDVSIIMAGKTYIITDADENTTGYNGAKNILLKNCTFDGGVNNTVSSNMLIPFHADGVTFDNVTFKNIKGSHAIDLNGSRNIKILNCNFLGHKSNSNYNFRECIQLDLCSYAGLPYFPEGSKCYDLTVSRDIIIDNCYFGPSGEGNTIAPLNAIGMHGQVKGAERIDNIKITNNTFRGNNNIDSNGNETIYGYCIRLLQCANVFIENNTIVNYSKAITLDIFSPTEGSIGEYNTGCRYVNITNNIINCGTGNTYSGILVNVANSITDSRNQHVNILVENNQIFDIPTESHGVYIEGTNACTICNNVLTSSYICKSIYVNSNNSKNVNSYNNLISGNCEPPKYSSNTNGCGEGLVLYNSNGVRQLLTI